MRIVFMGTPEFSVPTLSELIANGHEVVAVYTQPPRPAGRGKKLTPSPVHQCAVDYGIEVFTPQNFKAEEDRAVFASHNADVAIVVAYGLILPQAILDMPTYGCLNIHASLLPRWRGAAPIQRAIMAGDSQTGVQIMQMEKGLDTGPILLSEAVAITAQDTAASLHDRLAQVGAQLLPRTLAALERGALVATAQSDEGVTYAEKITPQIARIDWARPAQEVDAHIRGLSPFPGAWFEQGIDNARVKVLMSAVADGDVDATPGTVIACDDKLVVACAKGAVKLLQLQRAGKQRQLAADFLRGVDVKSGDVFAGPK